MFYHNVYPIVGELVMGEIATVSDIGVMCHLLEYNKMDGFLPFSEISRKNVYTRNILKVGQKVIFIVTNVTLNMIDLSKKFIMEEENILGKEKYKKGKFTFNICNYIAEQKQTTYDIIYHDLITPLLQEYNYPYDAFKLYANDTNIYKILPVYNELLLPLLKQQLIIQPIKLCALIDVTCFIGGIVVIKQALKKGQLYHKDIKINLYSSPTYTIMYTTIDMESGIILINTIIDIIKTEIINNGGEFKVVKEPDII